MWLTEREQRARGKVLGYSWQKLADLIEDKNHIMHLAFKFRKQKEVLKEEQDMFMKKLKDYIEVLKGSFIINRSK